MAPNTALEPGAGACLVKAAAQCEPLGSPTALVEKTSVSRHSTRRMGSFSREVAGDRSLAIEYAVQREGRMDSWRSVFAANGEIQAQQVLAFLEAAGISSELRGESLRKTHGLTLDGLGMVEVLVAAVDEDRARALLASAEGGKFRLDDDAQVGPS